MSDTAITRSGHHQPTAFVRNVCSPANVFCGDASQLNLSRAVAQRLPQRSQALLRPAEWALAYRMPFAAGNFDYRSHPLFDPEAERAEQFIAALAKAAACPVPNPDGFVCFYRDVADPLDMQYRADVREVVLPSMPEGMLMRRVKISLKAIAEYGIGRSWGWVCDEEVIRVLDPHLLRPYFIVLTCVRGKWRIRPAPPGADVGETRFA